jgi:hypothetical protein
MRLLTSRLLAVAALAALAGLSLPAPAADKGEAKLPEVGKPAPAVELPAVSIGKSLPDSKKKTLRLADLKGKNVVLYFYPKALTGG